MTHTVLIVEDDKPTCALWKRHLEYWGWRVLTVDNADDAEWAIDHHNPSAVVLDVMLADERSGWDLLAKWRSTSKTRDLPVFIVSALDEPRRAFREGANGFMLKPCSPNTLVNRINEELNLLSR
jgi:DNA-binding response OmpR family regulator